MCVYVYEQVISRVLWLPRPFAWKELDLQTYNSLACIETEVRKYCLKFVNKIWITSVTWLQLFIGENLVISYLKWQTVWSNILNLQNKQVPTSVGDLELF